MEVATIEQQHRREGLRKYKYMLFYPTSAASWPVFACCAWFMQKRRCIIYLRSEGAVERMRGAMQVKPGYRALENILLYLLYIQLQDRHLAVDLVYPRWPPSGNVVPGTSVGSLGFRWFMSELS
jgi:hypothetical protein